MDEAILATARALRRNEFNVICAGDADEARARVLELIPVSSTVGTGDSATVRQIGVLPALAAGGRLVIDGFAREVATLTANGEISVAQRCHQHRLAADCDFFLTGTNVVTRDGKLVNIDGGGNRVAGMIFGPRHAIIVVGRNKIVPDLNAALAHMKDVVSPALCRMKRRATPCATSGKCADCHVHDRVCRVTTILEARPTLIEVTVVLVDQDLGLGWDPDWPQERIDDVYAKCDEITWLKRPASG